MYAFSDDDDAVPNTAKWSDDEYNSQSIIPSSVAMTAKPAASGRKAVKVRLTMFRTWIWLTLSLQQTPGGNTGGAALISHAFDNESGTDTDNDATGDPMDVRAANKSAQAGPSRTKSTGAVAKRPLPAQDTRPPPTSVPSGHSVSSSKEDMERIEKKIGKLVKQCTSLPDEITHHHADSVQALCKKVYTEVRSATSYYERTDNQMQQLHSQLASIHAGAISMRRTAVACFPWHTVEEMEAFAKKRDMTALRLRLTGVPFKSLSSYATDAPLAIFSKYLIARVLTWPSSQ